MNKQFGIVSFIAATNSPVVLNDHLEYQSRFLIGNKAKMFSEVGSMPSSFLRSMGERLSFLAGWDSFQNGSFLFLDEHEQVNLLSFGSFKTYHLSFHMLAPKIPDNIDAGYFWVETVFSSFKRKLGNERREEKQSSRLRAMASIARTINYG